MRTTIPPGNLTALRPRKPSAIVVDETPAIAPPPPRERSGGDAGPPDRGRTPPGPPSTRKRMLVMFAGLLVLVAALGGGFYLHVRSLIAAAPKPGPQTVSTTVARRQAWRATIEAVGSLTAVNGVEVATQTSGLVSEVDFESGATVEAGTVLVRLDATVDRAQLDSLTATADLADLTVKRDREQLSGNAISKATLDADVAAAKSKRALAAQQRALLDQKTVRAPFAGRLGVTSISPGQYLGPGTTIVSLQSLDPVNVDFLVPQGGIGAIEPGMSATVGADAVAGASFTGRITAIDPKVDPATRNVTVRATVDNPDHVLLPGMFVSVSVDVGEPQRHITLPQAAIAYNAYGSTVFVVEGGDAPPPGGKSGAPLVARQIFVTTGDRRGDQVAIADGLKPGQRVVTSGQLKLKNGSPVRVDDSVQPANDPDPAPQEG